MAKRDESAPKETPSPRRAATTPEGREAQLVGLAVELAERQMLDGTASAQVISHYLKLGSTRERLEQDRIRAENDLLRRKAQAYDDAMDLKALFEEATSAMRAYQGGDSDR